MKSHKLAAIFLAVFAVAAQAATYIITGSGTAFTAAKDGTTVGEASKPIQTVIDAIRADAAGEASTIQFGNGSAVLNIGENDIVFQNRFGNNWGNITLTGKITSAAFSGTIRNEGRNCLESTADIANTGSFYPMAIYSYGYCGETFTNSLTISGGTVTASGNNSTAIRGNVTISGGTVTASGNNSTAIRGNVTISGAPTITGKIVVVTGGLEVSAPITATTPFSIEFEDLSESNIAVKGGADYMSKFSFPPSANGINLTYATSGKDIVLSTTNGYKVEKSGTTYTITKGSGTYLSIRQAIGNIQTQAKRSAATIQFGTGTMLDIGSESIDFYENGSSWGAITLAGKVAAYIYANGVSITTSAEIGGIDFSSTIYENNGKLTAVPATLTINGGTISQIRNSSSCYEDKVASSTLTINGGTIGSIENNSSYCEEGSDKVAMATLNISGGTISGESSYYAAIYNDNGTVNISGGTINAGDFYHNPAIRSNSGKITVSGTAKIISDNNNAIYLNCNEEYTARMLEITGGTILAKGDYAVKKDEECAGTINITGGTLFAYGTAITDVIQGAYTTPSGKPVIMAWDADKGTKSYTAFASTDISKSAGTTAQWLNKNGSPGIDYANGTNTGFIELPVTVTRADPTVTTWPTAAAITYGAALSSSSLTGGNGPGTFAWEYPGTIPPGAGSHNYSIIFTPTDLANYNKISQSKPITVNKASGLTATPRTLTISNTDTETKIFDLSNIALNKNDAGTLTYALGKFTNTGTILNGDPTLVYGHSLVYNGNEKTSGTATQVITITSQNYSDINLTISFKATSKTEVEISGLTAATELTYDGTPKTGVTGTASSGDYKGATLDYVYAGTGISSTSTTAPANAGSYILTVSVPDTAATYFGSAIYAFTISKAGGAIVVAPAATTANINSNRITVTALTAPTNGQTVEYAISTTASPAPANGWQTSTAFTGLSASTGYYIFARTAANANYNAGTAAASAKITTLEGKAAGATVAATTLKSKTANSIIVNAVAAPANGQTVEYAKNTTNSPPASGWQTSTTFTGLSASTTYYIFARAAENDTYNAGNASSGLSVSTNASSSGGGGGGGGGGGTTPVLTQVQFSNHVVQIVGGLNLSVNRSATVGIYGVKGNLIQSQNYSSGEYIISLNNLPKGMYIVKASFGSEVRTLKVVR